MYVDGLQVTDPANTSMSQSNNNVWSLVHVEGAKFMDERNVPHGAVAEVHYYSKSLQANRRMHVYTPSGYEAGTETYPVFYLLHGAGDCDYPWSTVGRAGFILDNLIAEGKAKPMVVVMPAGHTPPAAGDGRGRGGQRGNAFADDFLNDIKTSKIRGKRHGTLCVIAQSNGTGCSTNSHPCDDAPCLSPRRFAITGRVGNPLCFFCLTGWKPVLLRRPCGRPPVGPPGRLR